MVKREFSKVAMLVQRYAFLTLSAISSPALKLVRRQPEVNMIRKAITISR